MGQLKFKAEDWLENPGFWKGEGVYLPNLAIDLINMGLKSISAIDFYEELFPDEFIMPHREPDSYVMGEYGPKVLKISPKKESQFTEAELKEIEEIEAWNSEIIDKQKELKQWKNEYHVLRESIKRGGNDSFSMESGQPIPFWEITKKLDELENTYVKEHIEPLENWLKEHKKKKISPYKFSWRNVQTITQGLEELFEYIESSKPEDFCMCRPVSYAGNTMIDDNARFLHAFVIEIDGIIKKEGESIASGLIDLFYSFERSHLKCPKPTHIVCSGNGIHLYYMLEKPVPLFPNVRLQLSSMKRYLTPLIWNGLISIKPVEQEAITQPFRCVGSYGKNQKAIVCAFEVDGAKKITLEYLNEFVPDDKKVNPIYKRTGLSLQEAKEKYPDWYEKRIVKKEIRQTWKFKNPGMYYSWIDKIMNGAIVGYRYKCLENLCSLAVKCDIPEEQLLKDIEVVAAKFDSLKKTESEAFTNFDIDCALHSFYFPTYNTYARRVDFLRENFKNCVDIEFPVCKRNGRTQAEHLKRARHMRELSSYENVGRPKGSGTKKEIILQWRLENPNGTQYRCHKDTGLSINTVKKWWNDSNPDSED